MADERDSAGVILVPPPLIYTGGLLLGLTFGKEFPQPLVSEATSRPVGGLLLSSGILLVGWFSRTMWRANTPFRLDEPAAKLVTNGPFRHSRNPGYLSFALIYAGLATLKNSAWSMLLLPAVLLVVQRWAIENEERYLERAFGEEYRRYKARTRRWI